MGYPVPQPPTSGGAAISIDTATRLRVLGADLQILAARSDGRVVDGTLQIVAGGLFTTLGVFIDDSLFRALLVVTGGVSIARGINQVAYAPDPGKPALRFEHMPMSSPEQAAERLRFGEEALFSLARRARGARLVDGMLTMAGAAVYVPLYYGLQRRDDPSYRFGDSAIDYVGLGISTIAFAAGLVTVIMKSEIEQRARAYRELDANLRGRRGMMPTVHFALTPRGASASVLSRF